GQVGELLLAEGFPDGGDDGLRTVLRRHGADSTPRPPSRNVTNRAQAAPLRVQSGRHAGWAARRYGLADAIGRGITVSEIAPMDQPIGVDPETTAAFIGRALRGPLDVPVPVGSVAEFRRRFGDGWPKGSLGPAVEQFFAHGGRRLYVVRVANGARGAMLCLPAAHGVLVLRGVEPGSTERIRAAVDYDRIAPDDGEHFNLTLQRLVPGTNLVADQEIYPRLSCREDDRAFVGSALAGSGIARPQWPLPSARPRATASRDPRSPGYVEPVQPGSDGSELTDYDLVGSAEQGTGIFALEQVE